VISSVMFAFDRVADVRQDIVVVVQPQASHLSFLASLVPEMPGWTALSENNWTSIYLLLFIIGDEGKRLESGSHGDRRDIGELPRGRRSYRS
jgi:hypothetical protein